MERSEEEESVGPSKVIQREPLFYSYWLWLQERKTLNSNSSSSGENIAHLSPASSLTPSVQRLLLFEAEKRTESDMECFQHKFLDSESHLFDWSVLTEENLTQGLKDDKEDVKLLAKNAQLTESDSNSSKETEISFEERFNQAKAIRFGAKTLVTQMPRFHQWIDSLDQKMFGMYYESAFKNLREKDVLLECFALHKEGKSFLAALLLCTVMERLFRDIIFTDVKTESEVPAKLSELIIHPAVTKILSRDQRFVISCTVGPLCALNLRNVLFHGFYSQDEFRPALTSYLILLLLSLAPQLPEAYSSSPDLSAEQIEGYPRLLKTVVQWDFFPHQYDIQVVKNVVDHSIFVTPGTCQSWIDLFEYFNQGKVEYALLLLFPLLEHSIRRIFAYSNASESALKTADGLLYTTLDIIFAEKFEREEEHFETNQIFQAFPTALINFFLDLFIWKGFRVRDYIAHRLIKISSISQDVVRFIFGSALGILLHYEIKSKLSYPAEYTRCRDFIEGYGKQNFPIFHPQALFIKAFNSAYAQISARLQTPPEIPESISGEVTHTQNILKTFSQYFPQPQDRLCIPSDFSNLPFTLKDEAKLTILMDVVNHTEMILHNYESEIKKLEQLIQTGKSKPKQRRLLVFLQQQDHLKDLICDFFLLFTHIEYLQMRQGNKDTSTIKRLYDFTKSAASPATSISKFFVMWELSSSEEVILKKENFSGKECARLWMNLPQVFKNLNSK